MGIQIKNLNRSWKKSQERSTQAISFSLTEKPESEIYLVEDAEYEKSFDYHIISGEKLYDEELEFLVKAIINFIQPGWYLLTCGDSYPQKQRLTRIFSYHSGKLEETQYIRVLYDSQDGHKEYYKILIRK